MATRDEQPDRLTRALASIVEQSVSDWELVLVDDGSQNEGTLSVLASWADRDPRIRLIKHENIGLTKSLNVGLRMCTAPLVARHDSDDWSEPDRLAQQVGFLNSHPEIVLVGTQAMLHAEDGGTLWPTRLPISFAEIVAALPGQNPFCHGSVVFRREAAVEIGGYRECLPCSQDYDFFWRLSERQPVANLDACLYHLRRGGGTVSACRAGEQWLGSALIRILARQRSMGSEDMLAAEKETQLAAGTFDLSAWSRRKLADNLLLGGAYRRSILAYMGLVTMRPFRVVSYLAVLRAIAYIIAPPLRRRMFDGG